MSIEVISLPKNSCHLAFYLTLSSLLPCTLSAPRVLHIRQQRPQVVIFRWHHYAKLSHPQGLVISLQLQNHDTLSTTTMIVEYTGSASYIQFYLFQKLCLFLKKTLHSSVINILVE